MTDVRIWTFVTVNSRDALSEWADHVRLPTRERALLDQKLDVLQSLPFEVVINTKLLAGPLTGVAHIYKLRVNASLAVRIMLCRGPVSGELCYTLLDGAIERGGKLDPPQAPRRASERRTLVIEAPQQRRKRHEGFRR